MSATSTENPRDETVLILAPLGRDAAVASKALSDANLSSQICADMEDLCFYLLAGVGAALITVEALTTLAVQQLNEALKRQPSWSDFPLIILTGRSGERPVKQSPLDTLCCVGNTMLIERPTGVFTLVSAAQAALRARRRQYEIRDQLIKRQELEASLKQRAAELAEANRLKDEFLATISHELRTPLSAILGWTTLLRRGQLSELAEKQALETIERNARAQGQLINDLLDVSRIITGKLRLERRPVDLNTIIAAALDTVRPAAEAKEINLEVVLDPEAGRIKGDPDRLQQVIWNLLSNGIKFTPKGGQVRVALKSDGTHNILTVSDTGAGISPEFLPFVFDRFRQADGSSTRTHGGLGLGLAIVRHLIELHGGKVQASSAGPGRGAEFTVVLPELEVHRSSEAREETVLTKEVITNRAEPRKLDGVRVLVVDDLVDARELVTLILSSQGAEVKAVSSVVEALAAIEQSQPDVVVSDIAMPGEDGYTLVRKLRSLTENNGGQIPAIALTAYAREQDRKELLKAGYQAHLSKPVEPSDLISAIVSLTRQHKIVRQA